VHLRDCGCEIQLMCWYCR